MDIFGIDAFYIVLLIAVLIGAYIIGRLLSKAAKWVAIGFVVFVGLYLLGFISLSWLHVDATKTFFLEWIPKGISFVVGLVKSLLGSLLA